MLSRFGPAHLAQRLVRARLDSGGAVGLALPPPDRLEGRLDAVLDAIYLIFNEGYSRYGDLPEPESGALATRPAGPAPFGLDLIDEALRLVELLSRHPAGQAPQLDPLWAPMRFQSSRLEARLDDATGALIPLAEQDRRRWDRPRIEAGLDRLSRAARGQRPSSFHLLAGIAACHATAPSAEATDWPRILGCYDALLGSARDDLVLRANRAVAPSSAARHALLRRSGMAGRTAGADATPVWGQAPRHDADGTRQSGCARGGPVGGR